MGLIFFTLENQLLTAGHKRTQVCERIIETGNYWMDQLSNWRRSPRLNSGLHRVSVDWHGAARCTHDVVLGVVCVVWMSVVDEKALWVVVDALCV